MVGPAPQPLVFLRRPERRARAYFFPGVVALLLFLLSREKHLWQWLAFATIVGVVLMHVFVWPFTWNGGGGPVGSRYFLPFYALFLVLIPATAGAGSAFFAFVVGALFTAQLLLNPFYVSLHPDAHSKSGALRLLPTELTLLHDLPVAQDRDRMRRRIGPPAASGSHALAYFLDDNAFNPEETPPQSNDWWFWVRGKSKAEIVLRGPVEIVSAEPIGSRERSRESRSRYATAAPRTA